MNKFSNIAPIGVFDSGVGGLSVLRAIWDELPYESVIYIADQAHVPYGSKSLEEVREYSESITNYLLQQSTKMIVVACNTASAASLKYLRAKFPEVPFVGMEPAVKPAVENSRSRLVGILATPATFQGELYASVVERFAVGMELIEHTCPGLVAQIEAGDIDGPMTYSILNNALFPMLSLGVDTIVLGCTHYPFVIPIIRKIVGEQVNVIDPAPAVARQVNRMLNNYDLKYPDHDYRNRSSPLLMRFITTGDTESFEAVTTRLLGIDIQAEALRLS